MTPEQRERLEQMRHDGPANREAIDAALAHIDALEAEVAELRDDRDAWMASSTWYSSAMVEWKIRAEHAEAEVARLREANDALVTEVSQLADAVDATEGENARLREALGSIARSACCDRCQEAALVAKAALKEQP